MPPVPAGPPTYNYADWPLRAQGALVDFIGPWLGYFIIYMINDVLGILAWVAAISWSLYNAYLGGQTGQSYGKKWAGTRLVREVDGQLIGGGMGIGRYFVHIIDSIACYIGWFWPLWDAKRQTFADKILKTVVVKV
jgi:uncharacterized RDD family membrane protein YckC